MHYPTHHVIALTFFTLLQSRKALDKHLLLHAKEYLESRNNPKK